MMKEILVTGGNQGIGKAICMKLLKDYSDTYVLLGSRNVERGQQAINDIVEELLSSSSSSSTENSNNSNNNNTSNVKERIELLQIDVSSDDSVQNAVQTLLSSKEDENFKLYGIMNNAGIGFNNTWENTINVNYFGPRRVNDAFGPYLHRPNGRIVNVSSASGPFHVSDLVKQDKNHPFVTKLGKPWTITGGIAELDAMARIDEPTTTTSKSDPYGYSKALLNAYTVVQGKLERDSLIVNAVTPGYIETQLTKDYGGNKKSPADGAVGPVYLMMNEKLARRTVPPGRYYGSDCVRSPLHTYRGPGEPPYTDDDEDEGKE